MYNIHNIPNQQLMTNLILLQKHDIPIDKFKYLLEDNTVYDNMTEHNDTNNKYNDSHLQKCIQTRHPTMVNYIKDYLKTITLQELNHINKIGDNALHLAVTRCFKINDIIDDSVALSLVKLLIKAGININEKDKKGFTALYIACLNSNQGRSIQSSSTNVVKLLLKLGADPNICDNRQFSPLHTSCERGDTYSNYKTIKLLVIYKADVNAQNKYLWTPLHFACQFLKKSLRRTVQLLLENGANPDLENDIGSISLNCLLSNFHDNKFKNKRVYKMLLVHGIPPEISADYNFKIPKFNISKLVFEFSSDSINDIINNAQKCEEVNTTKHQTIKYKANKIKKLIKEAII